MTREEVITKLNQIIADVLEIDVAKLAPTISLIELGADLLAIIEGAEEVEAELNIRLDDEMLGDIKTMNDLHEVVFQQLGI